MVSKWPLDQECDQANRIEQDEQWHLEIHVCDEDEANHLQEDD